MMLRIMSVSKRLSLKHTLKEMFISGSGPNMRRKTPRMYFRKEEKRLLKTTKVKSFPRSATSVAGMWYVRYTENLFTYAKNVENISEQDLLTLRKIRRKKKYSSLKHNIDTCFQKTKVRT